MINSKLIFVIATLLFGVTSSVFAQEHAQDHVLAQSRHRATERSDELIGIKEPTESNQAPTEWQSIGSPEYRSDADSETTQLKPDIAQDSASFRPMIHVTWASANSNYRRLYFEEKLLERHGLTDGHGRSVLRSSATFFSRAFAYPFISRKYWPEEFQSPYRLGRPGSRFDN